MGSEIWLNCHYKYEGYDIAVENPDEYSMLDLLMDVETQARKQNVIPPNIPIIKYKIPGMNDLKELESDKDLLMMFQLYEGAKEIHLYMECGVSASALVMMARNLMRAKAEEAEKERLYRQKLFEVQMEKEREEYEERVRQEFERQRQEEGGEEYCDERVNDPTYGYETIILDLDPIAVDINEMNDDSGSPIEHYQPSATHKSPTDGKGKRVKQSARRKLTPRKKKCEPQPSQSSQPMTEGQCNTAPPPPETQETQATEPTWPTDPTWPTNPTEENEPSEQNEPTEPTFETESNVQNDPTHCIPTKTTKRKIPRTTAKAKGVYKPKQREHTEGSTMRVAKESRRAAVEAAKCWWEDEDFHCSDDEEGSDVDTDWSFNDDEGSASDEGSVSLVDEDETDVEEAEWDPDQAEKDKMVITESDCYLDKLFRNGTLYEEMPWGSIKLEVWTIFLDKSHFKSVLRDFCVQRSCDLVVVKNEANRYTAVCADLNCGWRIHASELPDKISWSIKTMGSDHTCERLDRNPIANVAWLVEKLTEYIRGIPDVAAETLCEYAMREFFVKVPKSTMYKVKSKVMEFIHGAHDSSYSKLPGYNEMIKISNPGSFSFITWRRSGPEQPLKFNKMFVSFAAQFKGFIKGCRPLIGVDGCHLKGNYNGTLLSAVALDGNQELFPLAYALVTDETTENWTYFFTCLRHVLNDSGRDDWTFISDRMKGVETALVEIFPNATRRICCRHFFKNFHGNFSSPFLEKYFWEAANATSEYVFRQAMQKIKEIKPAAYNYLHEVDSKLWARFTYDPKIASPSNTNNFTESFNATLGLERIRPVLSLLEGIRRSCMIRIAKRQYDMVTWDDNEVTPYAKNQLRLRNEDSAMCRIFGSNSNVYEVIDYTTPFHVDLEKRTCLCGQWQITGIPCRHAVRVIHHLNGNTQAYCSHYYSVKTYKEAYGYSISPILTPEHWPTFDLPLIDPPDVKRAPGRPPRNRKRQPGEKKKGKRSITVKCRKCGHFGHNIRSCKGGLTAAEKKKQKAASTAAAAAAGTSSGAAGANSVAAGASSATASGSGHKGRLPKPKRKLFVTPQQPKPSKSKKQKTQAS